MTDSRVICRKVSAPALILQQRGLFQGSVMHISQHLVTIPAEKYKKRRLNELIKGFM